MKPFCRFQNWVNSLDYHEHDFGYLNSEGIIPEKQDERNPSQIDIEGDPDDEVVSDDDDE